MPTLTHTAFLPVMPGRQASLFETTGTALRKVAQTLSAKRAATASHAGFGGTTPRREAAKVVYMRFWA